MSNDSIVLLCTTVSLFLVIVVQAVLSYRLKCKVTELRGILQKRHQVVSRIKKNVKRAKLAGLSRPKTVAQKTLIRHSKKDKTAKTAVTIKTG